MDPRVNVTSDLPKHHTILVGGQLVRAEVIAHDSLSSSQATWNFEPPSTSTIIDRRIYIRLKVRFTFVPPNLPDIGVNDAPRAWPIGSITDTLTFKINGTTYTTNLSEYIHAIKRYENNSMQRSHDLSMSPNMPDQYIKYEDWNNVVYGGSGRNPLAGYGEQAHEMSRGGFPFAVSGVSQEIFDYVFTEPVMISPLMEMGMDEGLTNVNKLQIQYNFINSLNRMWSHNRDAPNNITGFTTEITDADLLVTYITPKLSMPAISAVTYDYYEVDLNPRDFTIGAVDTQTVVNSNALKLRQVPYMMYLYAKKRKSDETEEDSDTFPVIEKVNITWNNETLFTSASQEQLYMLCKDNDYNQSYAQYSNFTGSVLGLKFGEQIGLSEELAPGTATQATLRVQCTFVNKNDEIPQGTQMQFYILLLLQGNITVRENSSVLSIGDLEKPQVLDAIQSAERAEPEQVNQLEGSGFLGKAKHIVKKSARVLEKIGKGAKTLAPLAGEFAPEVMVAGDIAQKAGKAGRKLTGGGLVGGGLVGGAVETRGRISRSQLRRRNL